MLAICWTLWWVARVTAVTAAIYYVKLLVHSRMLFIWKTPRESLRAHSLRTYRAALPLLPMSCSVLECHAIESPYNEEG